MAKKQKTLGDIEYELDQLSPEARSFIKIEPLESAKELIEQLRESDNFKLCVLYPRYEELLQKMKREQAFERLKQTCRTFGKNPADHLPDNAEAFFRSYNRWKSRQLKKK